MREQQDRPQQLPDCYRLAKKNLGFFVDSYQDPRCQTIMEMRPSLEYAYKTTQSTLFIACLSIHSTTMLYEKIDGKDDYSQKISNQYIKKHQSLYLYMSQYYLIAIIRPPQSISPVWYVHEAVTASAESNKHPI